MTELANGLSAAEQYEDTLSVQEAELAMLRRVGTTEGNMLVAQNNLAFSHQDNGRHEEALRMRREVYSGFLKFLGEEHEDTLRVANNYASSLAELQRFEEAKSLLRKMMPVARRVLGESHGLSLGMRWFYARLHHEDTTATLANLREAVATLEEIVPTARRVFGGEHPLAKGTAMSLQNARAALRARETQSTSA